MQTDPAGSLGMNLIIIAFLVTVAGCCQPFETRDPLRLLQAKSNFGKVIRGCGAEFAKMMKELPYDDFQTRLDTTCLLYKMCRGALDGNSSQEVFNCMWKEVQENGALWTKVPSTPEVRQAIRNALVCSNRTLIQNLPLEKLDDTIAYGRLFLLRFG